MLQDAYEKKCLNEFSSSMMQIHGLTCVSMHRNLMEDFWRSSCVLSLFAF